MSLDKVEPMKHMVLVNIWPMINSRGGTEKVFCEMANEFSRRGYKITAICCDPVEGDRPSFPLDEEVVFINAYRKPRFPFLYKNPFRNARCFSLSKKKRKLNRVTLDDVWRASCIKDVMLRIEGADIFISFQMASTQILRERLRVRAPVITMLHGQPMRFFQEEAYPKYAASVESCAGVQVLMPEYLEVVRAYIPKAKILHIPNIAPQFENVPDFSVKKIITMARLDPGKRPILLLQALSLLKDRFPEWTCEWWGDFNDKLGIFTQVKEEIRRLGLEKQFKLCGPTDEVPLKLKTASVFVFPSAFEGFPLALAEAFSMGLPSVGCKDCTALNTLIRDGENGFLTEPTAESLAAGLAKLMESEELRRKAGLRGKEDMKAYSAEAVWGAWDKLISETIEGARAGKRR